MSHRIEQDKQEDRQSNIEISQSRDSPLSELSRSTSSLSDADYEFLFNQLLEGIAHGWHGGRITKFFNQLGDRGKQADWVAWLERLHHKITAIPTQSQHQLATMMIRFGDLSQAVPEINSIGTASRRIGRELLFSNSKDLIWEYVGSDLPLTTSAKQPAEKSSLSSLTTVEPESASPKSAIEQARPAPLTTTTTSNSTNSTIDQSEITPSEEVSFTKLESDPSFQGGDSLTQEYSPASDSEKITISFVSNSDSNSTSSGETSSQSEEFEKRDEANASPGAKQGTVDEETLNTAPEGTANLDSDPAVEEKTDRTTAEFSTKAEADLSSSTTEELFNVEFTSNNDLSAIPQPSKPVPVAVDMQQIINLIQQDEELAQQILQKLNVSSVQPDRSINIIGSQSPVVPPDSLYPPDVELIESWFNLGLKQVGAGKYQEAIASWEKALNLNPNLSEAWHNRGSALGRLGKYEEAVTSFQNALAIDPNNYQAWNDCAHALYQLQNWAEAVNSWNNAVKIMPGNHMFWYNRGCALEQLEDWSGAIASYERSLEIKPDFPPGRSRYINLVADNSRSN